MLCFGRRSVSRLYRLAHLFFNAMAKLTADLNHDLGTKTRLGSLRHAGDFNEGQRLNDAKSPTRRARANISRISVEYQWK